MEQHVLGCMFLDAEAVSYCINTLKYFDFASTRHQEIFLAMCRLHGKRINIDPLTVQEELKRVNKLQTSDDFVYIMQLSKNMPTTAQLHAYVEVLLEYVVMLLSRKDYYTERCNNCYDVIPYGVNFTDSTNILQYQYKNTPFISMQDNERSCVLI